MRDFISNEENNFYFWNEDENNTLSDHNNYSLLDFPRVFLNPLDLAQEKISSSLTSTNIHSIFFSYENIKKKLKEVKNQSFNKYLDIIDNYKEEPELKEIEYEMKFLKKKRKKYGEKVYMKKHNSNFTRGRKKGNDQTKRAHNKISADNIIKKIKGYFIEVLIIFVNAIINKEKNKKKLN